MTTFVYDARRVSWQDGEGRVTTYVYDGSSGPWWPS
jgi:hypothetical protein